MIKNLLILHLESIAWQHLASFRSSFPNLRQLLREAVVFDNFFSSATSTLMVVSYLFHGNDFEFDTATEFEGIKPAVNNPNLFSVLASRGHHSAMIALNGFHQDRRTEFASWPADLPPIWATNQFPDLFRRFDELTANPPFALYVWDLVTHVEHSLAVAPFADGLSDQLRRACAIADDALGTMLASLARRGLLDGTTVVVYGDHGDDWWTHGFKGGMIHGTEPYTPVTWTPLAIRDASLVPGIRSGLAATIDIAPTCLALLGIEAASRFPHSGRNVLKDSSAVVFSQNFAANQPDNHSLGIAKAFAAIDDTYNLVVSSRGLELYAYRLDAGNHANLLEWFELAPNGGLSLRERPASAGHFQAAFQVNPRAVAHVNTRFAVLRAALAERVAAKRVYIESRGVQPVHALDPRAFDRVAPPAPAASINVPVAMPSLNFSFRLV